MCKKIIRIASGILVAAAFILAVCTAGASDAFELEYGRFVLQIFISLAAMAIGAFGLWVTE